MDRFGSTKDVNTISPSLSNRLGKRPITIRGPLHLQCSDHGDDEALRHLVEEVIAWPDIEAGPLPVGSADLVSLRVAKDVATRDASVFIRGTEFGRVLFGAPTMYLTLLLSCANWAFIRAAGALREINIPGLQIRRVFSWALPSGDLGGLPGEFYRFANSIRTELSAVSIRRWKGLA